jgi:hypothetical protein
MHTPAQRKNLVNTEWACISTPTRLQTQAALPFDKRKDVRKGESLTRLLSKVDKRRKHGYCIWEADMLKRLFDWFEKKRLADWFEKISAAFMVGSVLSENDSVVSFVFSVVCLAISQALAKRS